MKYTSLLASAACALALSGAATQAATMKLPHNVGAPKAQSIVGTWLATYDGGVHIGYIQWHKGGTVMNLMDFAPKTGNVLLGDWKVNEDQSLSFSVFGWTYDDKGNTRTGYFTKSETDVLSGSTYSGNFEVTFYDLSGNIVFQHDGTLTATRVGQ